MNRSVQNEAAASLGVVVAFFSFQKMVFVALSLLQESVIHLETAVTVMYSCKKKKKKAPGGMLKSGSDFSEIPPLEPFN